MEKPITPAGQAAQARAKAERLEGEARDYWLWLAGEWDKTAARQGASTRDHSADLTATAVDRRPVGVKP